MWLLDVFHSANFIAFAHNLVRILSQVLVQYGSLLYSLHVSNIIPCAHFHIPCLNTNDPKWEPRNPSQTLKFTPHVGEFGKGWGCPRVLFPVRDYT